MTVEDSIFGFLGPERRKSVRASIIYQPTVCEGVHLRREQMLLGSGPMAPAATEDGLSPYRVTAAIPQLRALLAQHGPVAADVPAAGPLCKSSDNL
jgi:hypothetical protein